MFLGANLAGDESSNIASDFSLAELQKTSLYLLHTKIIV